MSTNINLGGKCGAERSYNDYHRIYNRYRVCAKKHSPNHYYNHREEMMKKQKSHYQNSKNKLLELKKQNYHIQKNEISDLKNQIITLREVIKSTISVS